jgi:hypothetical protein
MLHISLKTEMNNGPGSERAKAVRKDMSRQNPMARANGAGDMCQDRNKEGKPMHAVGPHI